MLCGALLLLDYYAQYIVGSNSNVKRECRVCLQIDLPAHATLSLGVQRSGGGFIVKLPTSGNFSRITQKGPKKDSDKKWRQIFSERSKS